MSQLYLADPWAYSVKGNILAKKLFVILEPGSHFCISTKVKLTGIIINKLGLIDPKLP